MKFQWFCEPKSGKFVNEHLKGITLYTIFVWVSREHIGNVSPRIKIMKRDYTIPSTMVYPKHDNRRLNVNSFMNPKVVGFYIKFQRV